MAEFAIKLALRDHLLTQIREIHADEQGLESSAVAGTRKSYMQGAPSAPQSLQTPEQAKAAPKRRLLPESCATKLYESAIFFKNKSLPEALSRAFQALAICDFTLGPSSPQSMIIFEHIANICDAQGNHIGADMMRATTFSMLFNGKPAKGKPGH